MKTFRLFSYFLLSIAIALVSCSKSGEDDTPVVIPSEDKIDMSMDALTLGSNQESISFAFKASTAWTASSSQSWCKVSPASGKEGSNTLTLTYEANNSYSERNATITIKCGTSSQNVTITQKQNDAFVLTSNKIEMNTEGGEAKIEVKANINYEVTINDAAKDWISVVSTRALTTYNVILAVAANESTNSREGKITIYNGDQKENVTVTQQGKPFIQSEKATYTVGSTDADVTLTVESNREIETHITCGDSWMSFKSSQGNQYTYHVNANNNSTSRTGTVQFKCKESDLTLDVTITQYGTYQGSDIDDITVIDLNKKN